MTNLTKIKEVTTRFGLTARTLRFYEDSGLIESIRNDDYAYRLYDEKAITRLQQILILRKLNISIKDIKQIFDAPGSQVVLEVLGKRADGIDSEIALLHELREIILDFINHIKNADFRNESEVQKLYNKAQSIETQLISNDYNGNVASVNRLLDVTEKLEDTRITTPVAIKCYKQNTPAMRFIGKKYASGGEAWKDWEETDYATLLKEKLNIDLCNLYEDGDALVGLMCHPKGDHRQFEYWLGYFTPENTPVPNGFEYEDFPERNIVACWLFGKEDEVFAVESIAYEKLLEEGFAPIDDWWFERYHPVRTVPDKKGYMIIDICFFANKSVDKNHTESFRQQINELVYGTESIIVLETMVSGTNRSDLIGNAGQQVSIKDGKLVICAQGDLDCMQTAETFSFPLRIDAIAKTNNENIRLYFNAGTLILNWEMSSEHLYLCDIHTGDDFTYPGFDRLSEGVYHFISWILHPDLMAIFINDELTFASNELPYINMLQSSPQAMTDNVRIGTAHGNILTVKSLKVTPIKQA